MNVDDRLFGLYRARKEAQLRAMATSFARHLDPNGNLFCEPLEPLDIVALTQRPRHEEITRPLTDEEADAMRAAVMNLARQTALDCDRHYLTDTPGQHCHAHCLPCHYQRELVAALNDHLTLEA